MIAGAVINLDFSKGFSLLGKEIGDAKGLSEAQHIIRSPATDLLALDRALDTSTESVFQTLAKLAAVTAAESPDKLKQAQKASQEVLQFMFQDTIRAADHLAKTQPAMKAQDLLSGLFFRLKNIENNAEFPSWMQNQVKYLKSTHGKYTKLYGNSRPSQSMYGFKQVDMLIELTNFLYLQLIPFRYDV